MFGDRFNRLSDEQDYLYEKYREIKSEIASLKLQLAEAGEEKKELRGCINCKYREAGYSGIMCDNCFYHRHWEPR